MLKLIVDLADYEGPVYVGRGKASAIRQDLDLDKYDSNESEVHILVPDSVYTMTSSFFLGLFGSSVVKAGSKQKFYDKYKFTCPSFLKPELDGFIARALNFQEHKNVHQPFMWDGDVQERHAQKEWQYFLAEKEAWTDCPIAISVDTQGLKITDPDTIEKLFNSIGLQYLLQDISQYNLSDTLDYGFSDDITEPVTPEEKAVSSVMNKISSIKKRI